MPPQARCAHASAQEVASHGEPAVTPCASCLPPERLLAQLGGLQRRPGGRMRRGIDREEPVIPHEAQLVLGLILRLEKHSASLAPWPLAIQMAPTSSMQTMTVMACSLFPTCCAPASPMEGRGAQPQTLEALGDAARPPQGCAHGLPLRASEARTSPCMAVVRVHCKRSPCVQVCAMRAYIGIEASHKA